MNTFETFVGAFPEFKAYDATQFDFWNTQAYDQLSARRFRPTKLDLAAMYFVAHKLVMGKRNQDQADAGKAPGTVQGPIASKSVDKVSVSYATGAAGVTFDGAGSWNETTYGVELFRMIKATGTAMYVPGPRRYFGGRFR